MRPALLRVYLDKTKLFPDTFNQVIETRIVNREATLLRPECSLESKLAADHDGVLIMGKLVHLFEADCVHFVVHV